MSKVRFLLEELFRSFKNSIFKDIILMTMFTISVVMSVIMCSHYMDIGDKTSSLIKQEKDSTWYSIEGVDTMMSVSTDFYTVSGCRNVMNFYDKILSSEKYTFYSVNPEPYLYMKEEDFENYIGKGRGDNFFRVGGEQHFSMMMFGEGCSVMTLKCRGMDLEAYRLFGLRTDEGEDFDKDSFMLENANDKVPIILGSNYRDYFNIGDTIDITYGVFDFSCEVIGILEDNTETPDFVNMYQESNNIDDYIIFPLGIGLKNNPKELDDIEGIAYNNFEAMDWGVVQVSNDIKVNDVVYELEKIAREFNYDPLRVVGTPLGINVLRNESEITIKVMLMLTIIMTLFSVYGLFILFYDKVKDNGREYGIYLMNGCDVKLILSTCLIEIALILAPSLLVSKWLFSIDNVGYYKIDALLNVVCLFVGVIYIVGAIFVLYVFRGVDIEHLIRGKE